MPFYIRKSISVGPFRFNLSKSGVGLSVGVKGLRIGTGPKGHYIHVGSGGFYYHSALFPKVKKEQKQVPSFKQKLNFSSGEILMTSLETGETSEMLESNYSEICNEVNQKRHRFKLSWIFFLISIFCAVCITYNNLKEVTHLEPIKIHNAHKNSKHKIKYKKITSKELALENYSLVTIFIIMPGLLTLLGARIDNVRRSTVLFYDLNEEYSEKYQQLVITFDKIRNSKKKWLMKEAARLTDIHTRKRNAGAGTLVSRKKAKLTYELPKTFKSNITPICFSGGKISLYFLPDIIIADDGKTVGGINYKDIQCETANSRFIEEERVPSDATIVDYTWKHPNKNGTADKRFKNNFRIPICLYDSLHLFSESGFNQIYEFSKLNVSSSFIWQIYNSMSQINIAQTIPKLEHSS